MPNPASMDFSASYRSANRSPMLTSEEGRDVHSGASDKAHVVNAPPPPAPAPAAAPVAYRPPLGASTSVPNIPDAISSPSPPPPAPMPATSATATSTAVPPPATGNHNVLNQSHVTAPSSASAMRPGRSGDAISTPVCGSYAANRAQPGMISWPHSAPSASASASPASTSVEHGIMYSLERLHSTALALYNCVGEQLGLQSSGTRTEDVYTILPLVSEINQEVRTLMSSLEHRAGRDAVDMAPYYPWVPGNSGPTPPSYWSPSVRDERDTKLMRLDEDKLGNVRRRAMGHRSKAEQQKTLVRPRMRSSNSADDLVNAARLNDEHTGGSTTAGMATAFSALPKNGSGNSGGAVMSESDFQAANAASSSALHSHAASAMYQAPPPQQAYVPKYRKRSRAPAPGLCHSCGNSDTPEWRRGPDGARTLCNACGLHFAKLVRRRTLEYANSAPGVPIPPVTIAELRQSTNVNIHLPSVAQADNERARVTSAAASHSRAHARKRSNESSTASTSLPQHQHPHQHQQIPHQQLSQASAQPLPHSQPPTAQPAVSIGLNAASPVSSERTVHDAAAAPAPASVPAAGTLPERTSDKSPPPA